MTSPRCREAPRHLGVEDPGNLPALLEPHVADPDPQALAALRKALRQAIRRLRPGEVPCFNRRAPC